MVITTPLKVKKMAKILGKVGELGLDELFVTGISKQLGERLLSGFIGNSTLMSGAIKIAIASFMPKGNKYMKSVAMGIGVDGIEDIIVNLLGGVSAGASTGGEI